MSYGIYLAEAISVSLEDNRTKLRVLPFMKGIEDDSCPIWPHFFKDNIVLPKAGELLWVICDDEFSTGYVLGFANYNTYRENGFQPYSIPDTLRTSIDESLKKVRIEGLLDYSNLKVEYWDENCIHFIERNPSDKEIGKLSNVGGAKIIAYSNGTIYIFRSNEFFVKIGQTSISVTNEGVSISGASFNLASPDINLGVETKGFVMTAPGEGKAVSTPSKCVKA